MPPASHAFSATSAAALLEDGMTPLEAGDEKPGDVLGDFRLVEKLGEGGFGLGLVEHERLGTDLKGFLHG